MNILSSYIVIILLAILAMVTPTEAARQFGIRRSNNKIQPAFVSSGVSIDSSVQDTITSQSQDIMLKPRYSSSSPPKRPRQVLSAAMVACISGVVIGGVRQLCEVAGVVI